MTRQAERSEATRAKLVTAARELFQKRGYTDVATEDIVRRAKVTRGALYHHFADKRDLFRAVYEQMEGEMAAAVGAKIASAGDDPLGALRTGARIFLDLCADPELARVGLVDAPVVLGWNEWRRIGEEHGLGLIVAGLQAAMEAGQIPPRPVRPLAHLLLGAMGEAGMMIANAEDPARARRELEPALISLIDD